MYSVNTDPWLVVTRGKKGKVTQNEVAKLSLVTMKSWPSQHYVHTWENNGDYSRIDKVT